MLWEVMRRCTESGMYLKGRGEMREGIIEGGETDFFAVKGVGIERGDTKIFSLP